MKLKITNEGEHKIRVLTVPNRRNPLNNEEPHTLIFIDPQQSKTVECKINAVLVMRDYPDRPETY